MTKQMHEVKDRLLSDFEKNLDDIYSRYQTAQDDAWKKFQETSSIANKKLLQKTEEVNSKYLCKITENIGDEELKNLTIEFEEQLNLVSKEHEETSKDASDALETALKNASVEHNRDLNIAQQHIQNRLHTYFDKWCFNYIKKPAVAGFLLYYIHKLICSWWSEISQLIGNLQFLSNISFVCLKHWLHKNHLCAENGEGWELSKITCFSVLINTFFPWAKAHQSKNITPSFLSEIEEIILSVNFSQPIFAWLAGDDSSTVRIELSNNTHWSAQDVSSQWLDISYQYSSLSSL